MAIRFRVINESQTGSDCFVATVVDTSKPHKEYLNEFEAICECHYQDDAERIAAAMNRAPPSTPFPVLEC